MRKNPERFAFNILLAAFAVFLIVCGATVYGIQWFVFQSRIPLDVVLTVSRGTVSVIAPDSGEAIAVTDLRADLNAGTQITTDENSQALLSFYDPRNERLIGEWVLHHDSDVTLADARGPRFGLNRNTYLIVGNSAAGRSEVQLFATSNTPAVFDLTTPETQARFSRAGHYVIDASGEQNRVATLEGTAEVLTRLGNAQTVDVGMVAVANNPFLLSDIVEAEQNLLANANFRLPDMEGWDTYTDGVDPQGNVEARIFQGRPVVFIDRSTETFPDVELNHGEVGATQEFDVSTSGANALEIRATFRVSEQSLSTCGIAGSECGLMLRMDYVDEQGEEQVWIHGFYATHLPELDYPLRCDTCPIDHDRIALDRWYTFESGNLMRLLPEGQTPADISSFRFYASGHAFQVYVAEVSLLVLP